MNPSEVGPFVSRIRAVINEMGKRPDLHFAPQVTVHVGCLRMYALAKTLSELPNHDL